MARTDSPALSLLALVAMVAGLSAMFFLEWRSARGDLKWLSGEFQQALRQLEQKIESGNDRTATQLLGLRKSQDDLRQLVGQRNGEAMNAQPAPALLDSQPQIAPDAPASEVVDLPPLPEEIQPEGIVKQLKPDDIVGDPRFNPTGRTVTPTEMSKISAAVTRGHAMIEAIDSEVRAHMMEAMDTLRAEGNFIEYADSEEYQKVDGVLTAAEAAGPHRLRMYYLYPERFPQIYELKKTRTKEAALALRKAILVIDNQDPQGGE